MSDADPAIAFVRDRIVRFLASRRYHVVLDQARRGDGWRGEFVSAAEPPIAAMAHKPAGAPFVTLGVLLKVGRLDDAERILRLLDEASEYDVAAAVMDRRDNDTVVALNTRMFYSGLNTDDLEFAFENLLHCREAVAALFEERT